MYANIIQLQCNATDPAFIPDQRYMYVCTQSHLFYFIRMEMLISPLPHVYHDNSEEQCAWS